MTPMEIALSVIGFVRETLGLTAYNNILKNIFMSSGDVKRYLSCLAKFRKCFKIQEDNNHNCDNKKNNIEKNSNSNSNNLSYSSSS